MRGCCSFILLPLLVAGTPALADSLAQSGASLPVSAMISTPSPSGQSALERALDAPPVTESDSIKEQIVQAQENVKLPETVRQNLIDLEQTRLASLQNKVVSLERIKQLSDGAQGQKTDAAFFAPPSDINKQIETVEGQVQKSQQRLSILQSGPLTRKSFEAYKQVY